MNGDVEFAETTGSHNFPRAWGRPAGDRWSEERSQWIKDQINRFAGQSALDQLARHDNRYLHTLRIALLMARRSSP